MEWDSFSAAEKQRFWKDVGACDTKEDQEQLVVDRLSKVVEETRCVGTGGKYLPLSVYAAKGFDTSQIEQLCEDKKQHKLFGTVYRVDIEYQSKETKEKQIRQEILKSVQERKGSRGGGAGSASVGAGAKPKAKAKPQVDPTIATTNEHRCGEGARQDSSSEVQH